MKFCVIFYRQRFGSLSIFQKGSCPVNFGSTYRGAIEDSFLFELRKKYFILEKAPEVIITQRFANSVSNSCFHQCLSYSFVE